MLFPFLPLFSPLTLEFNDSDYSFHFASIDPSQRSDKVF